MHVLWQKGYNIYPGERKDVVVDLRLDGKLIVTCTFSVATSDEDITSMVQEWASNYHIPEVHIPAIIEQVKQERDEWKMPREG